MGSKPLRARARGQRGSGRPRAPAPRAGPQGQRRCGSTHAGNRISRFRDRNFLSPKVGVPWPSHLNSTRSTSVRSTSVHLTRSTPKLRSGDGSIDRDDRARVKMFTLPLTRGHHRPVKARARLPMRPRSPRSPRATCASNRCFRCLQVAPARDHVIAFAFEDSVCLLAWTTCMPQHMMASWREGRRGRGHTGAAAVRAGSPFEAFIPR